MSNPNLFVWTSDWHVVSDDSDAGGSGETYPTDATAVAAYIASLTPAGIIDTGDCKDHYGADTGDEHDNYISHVRNALPWAGLSGTDSALLPILPGNHDEVDDYSTVGSVTDLSLFNARFWGPPYHWTVDWNAAQIRFIAVHSYIHHSTDGKGGFAHITSAEMTWLQARLDALPANWVAIVCSHFPANPAFGNYIHFVDDDFFSTAYTDLLAAYSTKIVAYLNGHRHQNMTTGVLNGITHFNGPGMSYTLNNVYGAWVPITLDTTLRTLTFDLLLGPPGAYGRKAGFTPVVVSLPALPAASASPTDAAWMLDRRRR